MIGAGLVVPRSRWTELSMAERNLRESCQLCCIVKDLLALCEAHERSTDAESGAIPEEKCLVEGARGEAPLKRCFESVDKRRVSQALMRFRIAETSHGGNQDTGWLSHTNNYHAVVCQYQIPRPALQKDKKKPWGRE